MNFLLNLIVCSGLLLVIGCSTGPDDVSPEVAQVSTFESSDFDGDGIPNGSDKSPYEAYFPHANFSAIPFESSIELLSDDQVIDFELKKDISGDVNESSQGENLLRFIARKAVAKYFRSKLTSEFDKSIRNESIYIFKTSTLRDKAKILATLNEYSYDKFRDSSGKIEVASELRFNDLYKEDRINSLSLSFYTVNEDGGKKKLVRFPVNGEITISTESHPVEKTVSQIDPTELLEHETRASSYLALGLDSFEYKFGKSIEKLSDIRRSTFELNVIEPDSLKTLHISYSGFKNLKTILKEKYKDSLIVNGNDFVLNGYGNNLPIETNLKDLEGSQNGRWFVISSKGSSGLNGLYSAGETATLIYMTGDEIFKSLLVNKITKFRNISDSTGVINIQDPVSIEVLFQGGRRFGTRPKAMNGGYSGWASGRGAGHFHGNFSEHVDERLLVARGPNGEDLVYDPFELIGIEINGDLSDLRSVASGLAESASSNFKIFEFNQDSLKERTFLNIYPATNTSTYQRGFHSRSGWDSSGNAQLQSALMLGGVKTTLQDSFNLYILTTSLGDL